MPEHPLSFRGPVVAQEPLSPGPDEHFALSRVTFLRNRLKKRLACSRKVRDPLLSSRLSTFVIGQTIRPKYFTQVLPIFSMGFILVVFLPLSEIFFYIVNESDIVKL